VVSWAVPFKPIGSFSSLVTNPSILFPSCSRGLNSGAPTLGSPPLPTRCCPVPFRPPRYSFTCPSEEYRTAESAAPLEVPPRLGPVTRQETNVLPIIQASASEKSLPAGFLYEEGRSIPFLDNLLLCPPPRTDRPPEAKGEGQVASFFPARLFVHLSFLSLSSRF